MDPCGPIYVVTGDKVGKGRDNEPLLRNVKIIDELPLNYFMDSESHNDSEGGNVNEDDK